MENEEANKIIYDEAKRSFDISIESIRAYDKRVHQILLLITTSLGILFIAAGFLKIDFFSKLVEKLSSCPPPPLEVGCLLAFLCSIGSFFVALILCLKAYASSKFHVLNPRNVKEGYDSLSDKNDFLDELIYQISDDFKENSETLNNLWRYYTKSIRWVSVGWALLAIFVVLSIIIAALQ